MENMDLRTLYFPFLIAAIIALGISGVGIIMKPRHLFVTNFIIMLGLLEHILIFTQVIANFYLGNAIHLALSIIIWVVYIGVNITFYCLFLKRVKS
jgi:hypothetical protein